jgi:FkbM family methyltransferase
MGFRNQAGRGGCARQRARSLTSSHPPPRPASERVGGLIGMKLTLVQRIARLYARMFAVTELSGLHYLLLNLSLRGLGILNYYDAAASGEQYFVRHLLPKIVKKDHAVLMDVGANRGEYSQMLGRSFPSAQIYAFEPHPGNFHVLAGLKMDNFHPLQLALGATSGNTKLYDYAEADGSSHASLYEGVFRMIRNRRAAARVVEMRTLDSIARSLKVNRIDLLKIDTEGGELSVLRGAKRLLQNHKISVIQFEFNEMNVFSRALLQDFRDLLPDHLLYRLLPRGMLPIPPIPLFSEVFAYQNIVALPVINSWQAGEASTRRR